MTVPHPFDPGFAEAYSHAWTAADPGRLLEFFTPAGEYTDVAMGGSYTGHEEIGKFHRFMLAFAPDSVIEFHDVTAIGGRLYAQWDWSGSFAGKLRLRSGKIVDPAGARFTVPGVAVCRYDEFGLLTSHSDFWDLGTVLNQAGVSIG
ncbi:nuclear transport factor 2 family protein [Nocardia vaccinii]|uniref:nuclear transport factor 2 family protein n=1 Tax=Nocardia vaccinii TaxID=1822 RepID=UPI000836C35D|nr:nuclear transport factor 2 family protein [Nocardia vaccinii]